jgi:hypothetical protein
MEEVTGSIPVRSTNHLKPLEAPAFRNHALCFRVTGAVATTGE